MRLYDTLSGEKGQFSPHDVTVRLYVCGVTPYAPCHVGHAMSYVIFDVLRRYLEYQGYEVQHIQNITDVDDKLIQRAAQEGVSIAELADRYIAEYFENMDALNICRASAYPRVSHEMPRILEMIQGLLDNGYAYTANGDVYFKVGGWAGYGRLSKRDLDGMMVGVRVEPAANKDHPMDFALWKAAKPSEPQWDSPWGPGRPGWHIECSAMALGYLEQPVDIHGGGLDLVFPHHDNEIAQSEAYTGKSPFVRFWLHNGLLQLGDEKMSKSVGNLVTVREALDRYDADSLRLFFLSSHYRSPLTYTDEGVAAAERAMERMRHASTTEDKGTGEPLDAESYRARFLHAMDDDLNTPQALAVLFDLARAINRGQEENYHVSEAQAMLRRLGRDVLGITFQETASEPGSARPFIEMLVETRDNLRVARQFAMADAIRDRLANLGVTLTDAPDGTQWMYRESISGSESY